jgi:hypothetical protein
VRRAERARRRAAAAVAAALAVVAAGCSSGGAGQEVAEVADRLRHLERATLSLLVESGATGFIVEGAFSVSDERPLPVAHLTYTPAGGGQVTTVVLTGMDGFVVVDEQAYRLPGAELAALRVPPGGGASAVSTIRLTRWFEEVSSSSAGVYEGPGDPEVVLEDVVALASGLGAGDVRPVAVEGPMRVRMEARDDRDLRQLEASADGFRFTLSLSGHGEPLEVEAPPDPLPFEELTG